MKKVKKIISWIMSVITALIFIFGLTIFVSVLRASSGGIPTFMGYSVMQVKTGSMEPNYKIGSIIVVEQIDVNKLKVGDVISFYSTDYDISGKVNTHRIAEITTNMTGYRQFITKGDANAIVDDEVVSSISIIGKVVYNVGEVSGSVISVIKNPKVIFFLIILPLIALTFGEAFNIVSMAVSNAEARRALREQNEDGSDEEESDDEEKDRKRNPDDSDEYGNSYGENDEQADNEWQDDEEQKNKYNDDSDDELDYDDSDGWPFKDETKEKRVFNKLHVKSKDKSED